MENVHKRLRQLREEQGLSLRDMASRVERDGGHKVSHDSVRNYEEARNIPSDYLTAVCTAFRVSPDWLLFGRGSPRPRPTLDASAALEAVGDIVRAFRGEKKDWRHDGWTNATVRLWDDFVRTLSDRDPAPRISVETWHPASDDEAPGGPFQGSRQVGEEELADRQKALSTVIRVADEHLRWLRLTLRDLDHVLALIDVDGIVVVSQGSTEGLRRQWRLEPGSDWSKQNMGRTAPAAALASDHLSAVIGTSVKPFHEFACLAAPLHDASGATVGVLNLATRLPDASPPRMMTVAYVARMIERDAAGG